MQAVRNYSATRLATELVVAVVVFLSFAGVAAAASTPTVSTDPASGVAATGATLNGMVNPNGAATSWYFEYGTSTKYGQMTPSQDAGSGTSPVNVSAPLSGLQTGKLYHFRLDATSSSGTSEGADQTFTPAAAAAAPQATTGSATAVTASTAKLNGSVNPNGAASSWYFEYGTSTSYGSKTPVQNGGSGTKPTNVSAPVAGLTAGTAYHYQLVASNATGTTLGGDQTFTASPAAKAAPPPPVVQTGAAQNVTMTTGTLTGSVNPSGRATNWRFDYGTTIAYGSKTPTKNAGSGAAATSVSAAIANLRPGTTYHYRLVATSNSGTSTGTDTTFTTLAPVTLRTAAFRVIYGHTVTLSGALPGGQAGVKVTVLAEAFGASSYTALATVMTSARGSWAYLARPTIRTTYEASANGSTTTSLTVGVQPAVSLGLISRARFSTRVRAARTFAGKLVQFQRRSGSRWVTLRRMRLSAAATAIFSATLLPHGSSAIRVAMSVNQAGPGYLAGFSRTLTYHRH